MRKIRMLVAAVAILLLCGAGVVACSPSLSELPSADASPTVAQAAPVAPTAPQTAPTTESPTTTVPVDPAAVQAFLQAWYAADHPPTTVKYVPPAKPKAKNTAPAPTYQAPAASGGGSGCVIPSYICERESRNSYTVVNPSSGAGGMYQLMPSTWNAVASQMGRSDLVGVPPNQASPADQDAVAGTLWNGGAGCAHWSAC